MLLQAREYTSPDAPPPNLDDGRLDAPFEEYGPLLVDNVTLQLEKHNQPLAADLDEDGVIEPDENFFFYTIATVSWPTLDTSSGPRKVILIHKTMSTGSVAFTENCTLQGLPYLKGQPAAIEQDKLDLHEDLLKPEEIFYVLQVPPSHGILALDGSTLQAEDTFTQADINRGGVLYTPNDLANPERDYFAAVRHGLVRVSQASNGGDTNEISLTPSISSTGRYIAFASQASNLVASDQNNFCDIDGDGQAYENCADIFVYDLASRQMKLVSRASNGAQSNSLSDLPAISSDGGWVAYRSFATNLVGGSGTACEDSLLDTNGVSDIFRSQVSSSSTSRYSIAEKQSGQCQEGNGYVFGADISAYGEYVGFASLSSNLSSAVTDLNNAFDVFLHSYSEQYGSQTEVLSTSGIDTTSTGNYESGSGTLRDVSVSDGGYGNKPYVAFASQASDLVAGDTNEAFDVFVTSAYGLIRLSQNPVTGEEGNGHSYSPSISADGRFIAFVSRASNFDITDGNSNTDIYVYDRDADRDGIFDNQPPSLQLVSWNFGGGDSDGPSYRPSISPDGRYIAFTSEASDLIPNDGNGIPDIFLHDQDADGNGKFGLLNDDFTDRTWNYSISNTFDYQLGNGYSDWASVSEGGKFVTFHTLADNLVPGDDNSAEDVYAYYLGDYTLFPLLFTDQRPLYLPLMVR